MVLMLHQYDQAPSNMMEKLDKACKEGKFVAWFKTSTKEYIGLEEAAKCLITKVKSSSPSLHFAHHPHNRSRRTRSTSSPLGTLPPSGTLPRPSGSQTRPPGRPSPSIAPTSPPKKTRALVAESGGELCVCVYVCVCMCVCLCMCVCV